MKILIIEDEQRTALDLQSTIQEVEPSAVFMGILDSIESAVRWFQSNSAPDLVFMDIQLADGLSFEIFEELEPPCPVVFCTAYDEYALKAFQTNSIDYILKPFDKASVHRALEKVRKLESFFQNGREELAERVATLLAAMKSSSLKKTLLISQRDKLIPISVSNIAYFHIEHEMAFLQTFDQHRHFANYTLDELEKMVDPAMFYRANRQYLVNKKAISEVQHYFARKLLLKLSVQTKEPVVVSKAKASDFLKWMEG